MGGGGFGKILQSSIGPAGAIIGNTLGDNEKKKQKNKALANSVATAQSEELARQRQRTASREAVKTVYQGDITTAGTGFGQ
jgi:predicted methyltransferase